MMPVIFAGQRNALAMMRIGSLASFAEMLEPWEPSSGDREKLLLAGARRVGVALVSDHGSRYRRFPATVITD
jgi:hypothetical protein